MKSNPSTKEDKMFHALHLALHQHGYGGTLEEAPATAVEEEAKRAMGLFESMIILVKRLGDDWIAPFADMRADELELGLLCLEMLVGLKNGEPRSAVFSCKFLERTFQVESSLNPYGLQIVPTDI